MGQIAPIEMEHLERDFQDFSRERAALSEANDSLVTAVAMACEVPYTTAHSALKKFGRKDRMRGTDQAMRLAIEHLGWDCNVWPMAKMQAMIASYPKPHDGLKNITTYHPIRFAEKWKDHKRLIFITAEHASAFVEGEVRDPAMGRALRVTTIFELGEKH